MDNKILNNKALNNELFSKAIANKLYENYGLKLKINEIINEIDNILNLYPELYGYLNRCFSVFTVRDLDVILFIIFYELKKVNYKIYDECNIVFVKEKNKASEDALSNIVLLFYLLIFINKKLKVKSCMHLDLNL